jgi:hypothetical protein
MKLSVISKKGSSNTVISIGSSIAKQKKPPPVLMVKAG